LIRAIKKKNQEPKSKGREVMQVARTIRELYVNCGHEIRKIFYSLTTEEVPPEDFEDLVASFYLVLHRGNMYRGNFEFGNPEAEKNFTPYVYTCCKTHLRNFCRAKFGINRSKTQGWVRSKTLFDDKGQEVDAFTSAVGVNFSMPKSSMNVDTAGGADALWGPPDPSNSFRLNDYLKEVARDDVLKDAEKSIIKEIVTDLHDGMEMSEVVEKRPEDKSKLYFLRRQARRVMGRYMYGGAA
jgi:hypothetical protein